MVAYCKALHQVYSNLSHSVILLLTLLQYGYCNNTSSISNCAVINNILNFKLPKCKVDCYGRTTVNLQCKQENLSAALNVLRTQGIFDVDILQLTENSNFKLLGSGIFDGIRIKRLDLSRNALSKIDPNAFDAIKSLEYLDLSQNKLTTEALDSLSKLENLKILNLESNNITSIPEGIFKNNINLISLNLASNSICSLPQNALNETKRQLEHLNFAGNCLAFVPASNLRNFQKLAHLSLKSNRIRGKLANLQFMNMPKLKELDLSSNSLTGWNSLTFMNVPILERLSLAGNDVQDINAIQLQLFEHLSRLDLSGNKIEKIPSFAFKEMKSIELINLDRNSIKSLEISAFSSLPNLQTLSMQNNMLQSLQRNCFDSLVRLRSLLLANNGISFLDPGMLSGMPQLSYMNLHSNKIAHLEQSTFQALPRLNLLDLGDNRLTKMPKAAFQFNPELFWLDLSDNQLESLERGVFGAKTANILLQGNPWNCNNDTIDGLVDYLVANNVKTFFTNQADVKCAKPTGLKGVLLKDLMIKKANETYFKQTPATSTDADDGAPVDPRSLVANNPYLASLDLTKISPQMIQYVVNGGQVPGVPPETLRQLAAYYLKQQQKRPADVQGRNSPSNGLGLESQLEKPVAQGEPQKPAEAALPDLPPLSSLPADMIGHVMRGGVIPGLTQAQTNEIKNRYVQSLLNNGKPDSGNSQPAEKVPKSAVSIQPINSTNNDGQSTALLTDLANLPPELLDLLINKEPTVFAQLVERLLRNKKTDQSQSPNFRLINTYENSSNSVDLDSLRFARPPKAPSPSGPGQHQPYDVNDLDLQADLALASYENAGGTNMGGWYTGVGLTAVGLVTGLLTLVLCLRHKKRVQAAKEADGAKLCPGGGSDSKASMESGNNGMSNNNVKVEELLKLETPPQWSQQYQPGRPYFYAAQTPTLPSGRTLPYGPDPRNNSKNLGYLPWLFPTNNSQASLYSKTEI